MRRREFIALIGAAAGWPQTARAKPVPRVGYIEGSRGTPWMSDFLGALSDLGYVDGKNIIFVQRRFAAPTVQAMKDAISEIQPDIDLLVVGGTVGGVAAKSAAVHIPVVFVSVGAPVDIGLVETLAHPGGNMTGTTFEATSETYAKRLQILKEILPDLSRVAVLGAIDDPNFPFAMQSLTPSAPALDVSITPIRFGSAEGLGSAFKEMNAARSEGLIVVSGSLTYSNNAAIAALALAQGLPSCHGFREAVAEGGLISLGPDLRILARQSARLVDKILKGARAGDLPVEQPDRYVMSVNLKTARALGLSLPASMIAAAEEVIE
jgi:putative tryptophan/tyrosine transport system substrate-binding protein